MTLSSRAPEILHHTSVEDLGIDNLIRTSHSQAHLAFNKPLRWLSKLQSTRQVHCWVSVFILLSTGFNSKKYVMVLWFHTPEEHIFYSNSEKQYLKLPVLLGAKRFSAKLVKHSSALCDSRTSRRSSQSRV